ncbi:MAG TPA: PA2779 family protein [Burkholderiaceae bacterium]|nr:PA2779 family protein [Burkholderiaceae bacterium]
MRRVHRFIAALASLFVLGTWLPAPARAALVSTEEIVYAQSAAHARIHAWLVRAQVRDALMHAGVDATQVQARVDALSDEEASELAARIDALPAGGDLLGVVFVVFLVLLITDILGITKIFPFTHPVR